MWREAFQNMESTQWPIFSLVLFVGMFLGVLVRTWLAQPQDAYEAQRTLPLADEKTISNTEVEL